MTEPEPQLLDIGMLLLDRETYSQPHIWTVKSVGQKSARIIAHYGSCSAEATLTTAHVPDGWHVLDNVPLAMLAAAIGSREVAA